MAGAGRRGAPGSGSASAKLCSPSAETSYVWPSSRAELIAEQERLRSLSPVPWKFRPDAVRLGGCFAAFQRGSQGVGEPGDPVCAAAVLVCRGSLIGSAVVDDHADDRYEAGLLALREGRGLERAVRALPERPDVLLVDATGRDHPRGAGLAFHLGAVLELPTVGVTHRPLVATGRLPDDRVGAASPLRLDDRIVGFWLRTRRGIRPLAVHAAWRTEPDVARRVVLAATGRHRSPEPIRAARRLARSARAGRSTAAGS